MASRGGPMTPGWPSTLVRYVHVHQVPCGAPAANHRVFGAEDDAAKIEGICRPLPEEADDETTAERAGVDPGRRCCGALCGDRLVAGGARPGGAGHPGQTRGGEPERA